MEANVLTEQITALVDNEITDQDLIKRLNELIEGDNDLRLEFLIQSNLKNLVRSRVRFVETPVNLKNQIIRQIKLEIISPSPVKKPVNEKKKTLGFFNWLSKPGYAFAAAFSLIIVAAAAFLLISKTFNSPGNSQIYNMLAQARQNFNRIAEGKLSLQLTSNSPEAIKKFFKEKGVKFDPLVPHFDDMKLVGAVVSDNNGEMLPHNLYKSNDGKLFYLYQADENCLKKKILTLSSNVSKMVDGGKYYTVSDGDQSALVWKSKGKVCVVVSNDNIKKIENRLLAIQDKW